MPRPKMSDQEWITFLKDCRSSGLTDKDWCAMHGMHPSTLYKAIKRIRNRACTIPDHENKIVPLKQEVVEVASIDENGIITQSRQDNPVPMTYDSVPSLAYDSSHSFSAFETTIRINIPSGILVELSNSANAAAIKNVLGALQSV